MEFKTIEEKAKYFLDKIERDDKKGKRINAFLYVNPNLFEEAKKLDAKKKSGKRLGRLFGKIIGVKSNINVLGFPCSCASKTLENYYATFDATAISRIKAEDGLIIGMQNMDEFAQGSSGETSAFGATQNPACPGRITGGTSSGSAASVAAGFCDISLGSDTGGSIRNPSSLCGVVGIKPSYGLISRHGLIDSAMSFDTIGVIAKNVEEASLVLNVIKGKDDKDTRTFESREIKLTKPHKVKIGVIRLRGVDSRIQKIIDDKLKMIKEQEGWDAKDIEIKYLDLAVQTYYLIQFVEFFSGTRKFDGRKYGKKIEDSCGEEVLRRILGGSEISKAEFEGQYYEKALHVKKLIAKEFESAFKKTDCIISPVVPGMPWSIGQGKEMNPEEIYAYDALTVPASIAGVCAVSIPAGKVRDKGEEIPIGMQIMCNRGEESKMLSIAKEIEKI